MRTLLPFLLILFIFGHSEAKKVKFSVDLTGYTISPMGVHVTGSFQEVAGFPGGDWQPDTSPMTNETGTEIYSIVVDIPAHTMYEYRFINGDQWYETEFVPVESRVGYNFNDNRWVWIDSLANDTTLVGPLMFAGNAPLGKYLLRLLVDMANQGSVDQQGIHVAGSFQGWNPDKDYMYSFEGTVHEIILWVNPGTYEYKYYNGNSGGYAETVPAECQQNQNRYIIVSKDTVLDAVCFGQCHPCVADMNELIHAQSCKVFPNPASQDDLISFDSEQPINKISVFNSYGILLCEYSQGTGTNTNISMKNTCSGVYTIRIIYDDHHVETKRIVVY